MFCEAVNRLAKQSLWLTTCPLHDRDAGVLIGPLRRKKSADVLATRVFKLLRCLGIRCSDINRVMVSPKWGYAKIELTRMECEDFLVKVLREVRSVMSVYDLRRLCDRPENLRVLRIRHAMRGPDNTEITDGGTATYRLTAGEGKTTPGDNEQPEPETLPKPSMLLAPCESCPLPKSSETASSSMAFDFDVLEEEENSAMLRPPGLSAPACPAGIKIQKSDSNTSSHSTIKPVMVSARTSTPNIYPCGCPDTVFYHHFQTVGTETRYAEFKHGMTIHDQKSLQTIVAKYVCGFLNSEGGTIYFGVTDEGRVHGVLVDHALEETLRMDIDFAIRLIEPGVDTREYSVNFARVMEKNGQFSPDMKVLEICVKPRKPPTNQFSYNGFVYLRRDGSLQALPK